MTGSTKLMTPSGGGVTLTATNTATDKTLTIPADNGTLVYANSSGNVGIGTGSPNSYNNTTTLTLNNTVNATRLDFNYNGAIGAYVSSDSSKQLYFGTNGNTERMRIDSSGNLLLGTTSALNSGKLSVQGRATIQNGSGDCLYVVAQGSNTGYVYVTAASSANAAYFTTNSGGTYSGAIYLNSNTASYNSASDYRLKENIQPMQNALATVAQLNPVTYTWKADGSDGQGFIAHELQSVVPDCVTGEKDAVDEEGNPVYQGIDTSFLVATLTKAIQELNEKVEAQAAEIVALKGAA